MHARSDRPANGTLSVALSILPVLLFIVTGCAQPGVQIVTVRSHSVEVPNGEFGVRFDADVSTHGMAGRQFLYQVTLNDRNGDPCLSRDGRYQTRTGQVAAARTFFVHYPVQRFDDLKVTIPADQLEFGPDDLPVDATMGIYDPSGNVIATKQCPLPTGIAGTNQSATP